MVDDELGVLIDRASDNVPRRLAAHAPASAAAARSWIAGLSPSGRARDYFDGGRAVIFLLPWWLDQRIRGRPDLPLQTLLVESSVNAYFFVRLLDNVMDDQEGGARRLLPLAGVFHAGFIRPYASLFPAGDPFWNYLSVYWNATAEAALREKTLATITEETFAGVVARKTSGIKIPLAAICCQAGRLDLLEAWTGFYDRLSCWLQMLDDVFDWIDDLQRGNQSYFLSEGERQRRRGESLPGWVVRRGFLWGLAWLQSAMRDLVPHARQLGSPELMRYLEYRDAQVRQHARNLAPDLAQVARLADVFEEVSLESGPDGKPLGG